MRMLRRHIPTLMVPLMALAVGQVNASSARPRVIYGDDDRVDYYQITDANLRSAADSTVAVFRAVNLTQQGAITVISTTPYGQSQRLCPNEPFYNQLSGPFCSGFLVSPDTVVTAGHCVSDQASCLATRFVFGYKMSEKDVNPTWVPTDQVFSCVRLIRSAITPKEEDFAVLKLDRAVTQFPPLPYRTRGRIQVGEPLHVIGHPAGLPVKLSGGAQVREVKAQFLVANLDTYAGNSGSAVFNSVTGEVEGILVRGEMDYGVPENGCRNSNRCPDNSCRGEDVTLFERVLPYLGN